MPLLNSDLFKNATQNALADKKVAADVKRRPEWIGVDVNKRLEACAVNDAQNIKPNPPARGPHVAVIHQALEKIAAAATIPVPPPGVPSTPDEAEARLFNEAVKALRKSPISEKDRSAATYGDSTAKAVLAYKKARDIRRPRTAPVDNIVGIMTIQAIDRDLQTAATGSVKPPPKPVPSNTKTLVDFVIRFTGGRDESANPNEVIVTADGGVTPPPLDLGDAGTGLNLAGYRAKFGRRLHLISNGARTVPNPKLSDDVAKRIKEILADKNVQPGIICIRGSSAGGRAALDLAKKLPGISIKFLGIEDASFFPNSPELTAKPLLVPPAIPLPGIPIKAMNNPKFNPGGATAEIRSNFWQDFQNFCRLSASKVLDWTSGVTVGGVKTQEIHGELEGFNNNTKVVNEVPGNGRTIHPAAENDIAHNVAVEVGGRAHVQMINNLLNSVITN